MLNIICEIPWVRQVEGSQHAYSYLDSYSKRINFKNKLPLLVILNCTHGCNLGSGTCKNVNIDEIDYNTNSLKKEKLKVIKDQNLPENTENIYKLFEIFDNELNIDDFIRNYDDKSHLVKIDEPDYNEYTKIFSSLHHLDKESQQINCYACGYGSCKEFAKSVHNDLNHLDNCIYYNKKELEIEKVQLKGQIEENIEVKKVMVKLNN